MKIGFTGTMSVGKTTLVNALKEHPEFKDYSFKQPKFNTINFNLNHIESVEFLNQNSIKKSFAIFNTNTL